MGYHTRTIGGTDDMDEPDALFIPSPPEVASMVNYRRPF